MTDPLAPTPNAAPAAPAPTGGLNVPGLVALILAVLAFLLAVIPFASGIAWVPAIAAIVLAIIGLTRKGKKKGLAIAGLIVAVVAWIVAIIVTVATVFVGVGTALEDVDSAPSSASSADSGDADESAPEAAIGDTVTNDDGVAFTVTAVACGIDKAGEEFLEEEAKGQYCQIDYTIDNGGTEEISVNTSDITGYIGDAEYDVESGISTIDGEYFLNSVNPGLSVTGVSYIDIPADAALEYLSFEPLFSFSGAVTVKVS
jgi:hypothetical protein